MTSNYEDELRIDNQGIGSNMDRIQLADKSAKVFIRQLMRKGLAIETILNGTQLSKYWLTHDNEVISSDQYIMLVHNALNLTQNPALGLEMWSINFLFELGIYGYAIMSSATLGESLSVAEQYLELSGGLMNHTAYINNGLLYLEATPAFPFPDQRFLVFAFEEVLSQILGACRMLVSQPIYIKEAYLTYPKPSHAYRYAEFIQGPIYFGAEKNLIIVPESILSLQTITGLPGMKSTYNQFCREMLAKLKQADTLIDDIRRLIFASINNPPHVSDIARELQMSSRTLYRKLKMNHMTYQDILDEIRAEISKDYLLKTNLSIDQISDLVGFSETTTFRRTFKKWLGVSPSHFRKAATNL